MGLPIILMSYSSELSYAELSQQDLEFSKSCWQDLEFSKTCPQDYCSARSTFLALSIFWSLQHGLQKTHLCPGTACLEVSGTGLPFLIYFGLYTVNNSNNRLNINQQGDLASHILKIQDLASKILKIQYLENDVLISK